MNKKLFGTLLLGSLLMGGTFVSCKDYDDDIENLQGQISGVESQITDVKALVAQLQSKLDGMTYVQNVTKSADGKTIKFTMSNGQTVEFTDTDTVSDPGSVVTVEDGVLCIDGEPTEIKVASAINMPKVENGQIYIFDEESGEYAATGIFVNQNTVVESATKYTITMTTSDGTTVTYDVPKVSGLINEIVVKNNGSLPLGNSSVDRAFLNVYQYNVTNPNMNDDWKGPKKPLKKDNIVFGFGKLDIRVNPVAVDLKDVKFSLVNTKNEILPQIELSAKPEDGNNPLYWWEIGTRANECNGLWTLMSDNVVIEKSIYNTTLDYKLSPSPAYAVTAGGDARSYYNVTVLRTTPTALDWVYFYTESEKDATDDETAKVDGTDNGEVVLEVNKTYSLVAHNSMALYDVYMWVSDLEKETYGIVIDNEAHTIKYTKQPDVVTTASPFTVNIKTADNYGQVKDCQIAVKLSSLISANATFEAQTFDLANLKATPSIKSFTVALDPMKNALGATEYNRWANNVDLTKATVEYFEDSSCSKQVTTTATTAPTIDFVKADGTTTTDVNTLKSVRFDVAAVTSASALWIGVQYYAKVTFKNKVPTGQTPTEINSIVIPVKFTAPTVAEQFKPKAGYVVDGVINAYFYKVYDENNPSQDLNTVTLSRYFEHKDDNATLSLKNDDKLVKIDNVDYNSLQLAAFTGTGSTHYVSEDLKLNTAVRVPGALTEAGYGKVLTVNVSNPVYSNTSWAYNPWTADSKASFQIKIMSPIFEGTIKPANGTSVKLVANNVNGSNITSDMIVATDYTGTNKIEIMPDAEGTTTAPLAWSNPQIASMKATTDPGNTYISALAINPYTAATTTPAAPAKLGSINVKADPVSNDVDTHINVELTDAWGYVNKVKLPVTITKQ